MLILLVILACVVAFGHGADHDTFKDCSRVNFCSVLRSRAPVDKYYVNSTSFGLNPAQRLIRLALLANDGSSDLNLTISALADNTFRVQIEEVDSTRYQLEDVLDGQPEVGPLPEFTVTDSQVTITSGDNKVVVNKSPFSIEFLQEENLLVVLDGTSLNFDSSLAEAFSLGVSFPQGQQLYGIHEHAERLALQSTRPNGTDPYRLRNLDVSGYELDSPMALYGAVPVLYAHSTNSTSGIFLHNAAEQWLEITNGDSSNAYIMVESGSLDLFVLLGPTPVEVVRQYVGLTGTAHLPQLWALGYHQSRWNYMSQDELKDVVANFTTYDLPLDVIWLDIEYTDAKKYFTWDPVTFSDPLEMQRNISASHKRLVTIIDPHIKVEEGYNVYDGALAQGFFVNKTANGTVFQGDCWPGLSSYIDFLNPAARDYYGNFYSYDNFPSTSPVLSGIWNDMNEPSVFDNSLEKTLPGDAVHYGGVAHRDIHNIYGLLHTKSTHAGLIRRDNGTTRPFVLTRSHFAGTQRYSAIWTGDNTADWGYLAISYSECLNANLLGLVFCGADVGGFADNPSVELLQRWYQAGAWLPFYRAHSDLNSDRREPFLFDDEVQAVIRSAIQVRYQHLPVWYTLFYEHTRNRDPIIRPLFYQYPEDEQVHSIDNQLLLGRDILVRLVAEPGADSVQVYFPGGSGETWVAFNDTQVYSGEGYVDVDVDLQGIPVYYRSGSVVVRKDTPRLSSDEMAADGHTLYVNLGPDNTATGTVYLDDNTSFNYATGKQYKYLRVNVRDTLVTLAEIDNDADSDSFDFVIDDVVINKIVERPTKGKAGRYQSQRYIKREDGQLLRDLRWKGDKTVSFRLL